MFSFHSFLSVLTCEVGYLIGRHAGTPLHHAAKRGLESIVKLLLLHGGMTLFLHVAKYLTIAVDLYLLKIHHISFFNFYCQNIYNLFVTRF